MTPPHFGQYIILPSALSYMNFRKQRLILETPLIYASIFLVLIFEAIGQLSEHVLPVFGQGTEFVFEDIP